MQAVHRQPTITADSPSAASVVTSRKKLTVRRNPRSNSRVDDSLKAALAVIEIAEKLGAPCFLGGSKYS